MLARRLVVSTLALGCFVWVPTAANAQTKMVLSGRIKQYCCDFPAVNLGGAPVAGWPRGYDWAAYYGVTPMNPLANPGGMARIYPTLVTATGASNKTFHLRQGQFGAVTQFTFPIHPSANLVSLIVWASFYNASATLANGASAGTFSFCPAAKGPGLGSCTAPSQATPPRNGRIYRKSTNPAKFGGTMALLGSGYEVKLKQYAEVAVPTYTLAYLHIPFTPIGTAPAAYAPLKVTSWTNPWFAPPSAKNGPFYHTGSVRGGGPWGTGYALFEVTKNANPPYQTVAVTGYDTRHTVTTMKGTMTYTHKGVGNLQLVSGVLYFSDPGDPGNSTRANILTLTLPEPGTAQGVALGALALALIGWTRARRGR